MAKDGEGGADVEIRIREHKGPQKVLTFKHPLTTSHARWDGESDLSLFGSVKGHRVDAFHELNASADAFQQLLHGRFVVVHHRGLAPRESCHAPAGDVSGDLHLTCAIEHVWVEATRQQQLSREAVVLSMGVGPFQQVAEVAEVLHQGWNQGGVERARQRGLTHGAASLASPEQQ